MERNLERNGGIWLAITAVGTLLTGVAAILALNKGDVGPSRSDPSVIINNSAEAAPEPGLPMATSAEVAPRSPASPEALPEPEMAPRTSVTVLAGDLPSNVDIFWCEDSGGLGENRRNLALTVRDYLADSGTRARLRVRPLGADVNRTPSYNIYDNIVRYDPGEADVAKALAAAAESAGDASFSAAPALPGSPSVDYLSIFVCR